jgi:hypothetical protein
MPEHCADASAALNRSANVRIAANVAAAIDLPSVLFMVDSCVVEMICGDRHSYDVAKARNYTDPAGPATIFNTAAAAISTSCPLINRTNQGFATS